MNGHWQKEWEPGCRSDPSTQGADLTRSLRQSSVDTFRIYFCGLAKVFSCLLRHFERFISLACLIVNLRQNRLGFRAAELERFGQQRLDFSRGAGIRAHR